MGKPAMTQRGEEQFEQLRKEAVCPGCNYSLRGLPGDVVTCPECGREINMVAFLKDRWTGSWYSVPGYNAIVAPAIWIVVPLFALLIWPTLGISDKYPSVAIVVYMIALLVWVWLMLRLRHHHDNGKAPLLALLAHAVVAGYLVGGFTVFGSLIQSVETISKGGSVAPFAMLILGVIMLWLAKRGEKFLAARCIQQLMIERSKTDTMKS